MPDRIRVLLLHNIMAPYRFPLFAAIARDPDVDLTVWFMSRSARNRRWSASPRELGFNYEILPSFELNYFTRDLFTYIINYTFPYAYARQPCDVLISAGWLDFASQAGFFLSKLLGRKFVLWSESTANEPSWRRTLAAPLVKTMVQGADACVTIGTRSREYLHALGAPQHALFTAFSTVDVAFFANVSAASRADRLHERAALGIRRKHIVLYCGQFIERKGLEYLVDAFALVKREYDDVALMLVGYGPMRQALVQQVQRLGLTADVCFVDHVEVEDMPKMYALADIFVLPSLEETWGLVVNEAMACGLPVIVSDRAGCSPDLVLEGENGYVVAAANAPVIAERTLRLLKNGDLRRRMSECSAKRIREFTPERAAEAFVRAVRHARGG